LQSEFINKMEEAKFKILEAAEMLFMRYGFKSITMDDIAREIGISKKTLYLYFTDKNDLVNQTVDNHLSSERNLCEQLKQDQTDPIEFLLAVNENFGDEAKHISSAVLFDLRKYFKQAWDKIDTYSKEFIFKQILVNLEEGKEKGLYRKEINERVIALYYISMVQFIVNPENYQKEVKEFHTMHKELIIYHLHGILTDKGMKHLEKLLKAN